MGELGQKFGHEWDISCNTVAEIFQLIDCQTPGFKDHIISCADSGTNFSIKAGKEFLESAAELGLNINVEDIYITEVPAGASPWLKILGAAAIIAIMWWNPGGWAFAGPEFAGFTAAGGTMSFTGALALSVALNLAISGINELLMPIVDSDRPGGSSFDGPVNTIKQGQPVPILYGRLTIGGAPISVSYTKRKISSAGFIYNSADSAQGDFDAVSSLNPGNLGVA